MSVNNYMNYIQPNTVFSLNISVMYFHSHVLIHVIISFAFVPLLSVFCCM